MPNGPSQPTRLGWIFRKFAPVGPDGAPGVAPFDELQNSVRERDEFESVVVMQPAWPAERITFQHAVFRVCNIRTLGSLTFGLGCVEQLFPIRRQGRSIPWRDSGTGQLLVEYIGEGFDNI